VGVKATKEGAQGSSRWEADLLSDARLKSKRSHRKTGAKSEGKEIRRRTKGGSATGSERVEQNHRLHAPQNSEKKE